MNYTSGKNCEYCGKYSGRYELCSDCYHLSQEEYIIKNEKGLWIKNIKKGNEYKFFDETKKYILKTNYLNEFESRYFNIIKKYLNKKYLIIPQVNLQTIIETDSNKRNDELFRNVDFVIYYAKTYTPFLVIELNGQQHYNNEYTKERDKSIKQILNIVQLPLLTIDIIDLKRLTNEQLFYITKLAIKQINPSFLTKLFHKDINKMDLSPAYKKLKQFLKENENKLKEIIK